MIITSNYGMAKIARELRSGDAAIIGRTCDGNMWPDGDKYYIIDRYRDQTTDHVRCIDRPSWARFLPKEEA